MSSHPLRVLMVEDSSADARLIVHELRQTNYALEVTQVETELRFLEELQHNPDIILCDWNLPQFSAQRAIELLRASSSETPLIVVSGSIGEEAAVESIKQGATDYLLKDRLARLRPSVEQALRQRELRQAERQAREELQASEQRYRDLVEFAPDAIAIFQELKVVYVNPAGTHLMGAESPAEVMGQSLQDLLHPDDWNLAQTRHAEILSQRKTAPLHRFRVRHRDGSWIIVESCAGPCTYNGKPGVQLLARDVTQRVRDEEALARLAVIVESADDAILSTTLEGVITSWNPGAERLLGYKPQEMIGAHIEQIVPPSQRVAEQQSLASIKQMESVQRYECTRAHKSGRLVDVALTISPMHDSQQVCMGVSMVMRDITERKQLEEQFRQAQKMEAVGRLAGGVAHDFNNLLTVINGYSEILLPDCPPDSMQRSAIAAIRDAGERATGLTSQLLAFSRKTLVEPRLIDLNDLISRAEKLLRRLIGEDIVLTSALTPNLGFIKADPSQIDQVVLNLAVNARDAMATGGRLTFETHAVIIPSSRPGTPAFMPPGHYVELRVIDTGCGMTEEVCSKIFEPFFTTKGAGLGTGLGLSVVHGIVQQAGGQIFVESTVGVGTTFRLLFPVAAQETTNEESPSRYGGMGGTETILLVEDEAPVREIAYIALRSRGYQVLVASGGKRAMQIAADHQGPIHLLLTDVVMPEMSGRELADELLLRYPSIKVLFTSGFTDDAVVRHGVHEATQSFLQKPFTPMMLERKVWMVLHEE